MIQLEKFHRRIIKLIIIIIGINTYSNMSYHLIDDVVLNQICGKKIVYMYDYCDNPSLEPVSILVENPNYIKRFRALDLSKYKLYKNIRTG